MIPLNLPKNLSMYDDMDCEWRKDRGRATICEAKVVHRMGLLVERTILGQVYLLPERPNVDNRVKTVDQRFMGNFVISLIDKKIDRSGRLPNVLESGRQNVRKESQRNCVCQAGMFLEGKPTTQA